MSEGEGEKKKKKKKKKGNRTNSYWVILLMCINSIEVLEHFATKNDK